MAFDEPLAERVRRLLARRPALAEVKMFGGLCFTLRGNMCCGLLGKDLIVRVPPKENSAVLKLPHARPFDFTGKAMKGFVYVSPAGYKSPAALKGWVDKGVKTALALKSKA
ncbi:MAG: TfoX/Sxy family protein [Elusimicrobia bacterium]|nr:TfoX/Sxy family protein [Elusimicrobiota bacterium]